MYCTSEYISIYGTLLVTSLSYGYLRYLSKRNNRFSNPNPSVSRRQNVGAPAFPDEFYPKQTTVITNDASCSHRVVLLISTVNVANEYLLRR